MSVNQMSPDCRGNLAQFYKEILTEASKKHFMRSAILLRLRASVGALQQGDNQVTTDRRSDDKWPS